MSPGIDVNQKRLLIIYASQTGNAFDTAERVAREAERRGCLATVVSIKDFDPSSLPHEDTVIFVVSTTGQGDAPDSMKVFWRFLLQRNLTKDWLQGVQYAVFGLGDSGYQKYNFVAKKLDKRLSDLGAVAIVERGLGDDQHTSGYEGALDPWLSSLWNILYQLNPSFFPKGPNFMAPDDKLIDRPKLRIMYHIANELHSQFSTSLDSKCTEEQIEKALFMYPGRFSHHKNRPECFLKMIKNRPLTRTGCGKDVRHLEFESISSGIKYEVGDSLEVLPSQNPAAIDDFLQRCNLNPEAFITVPIHHKRKFPFPCAYLRALSFELYMNLSITPEYLVCPRMVADHVPDIQMKSSKLPIRLKYFVELTMDVASASPRRYFFEVMSYFATAEHEKERLQYFASPEGRDDLYQYNQKERRTVLEVLNDFPSVLLPFEWLVQLVPPLKTRAFSISSSPSAHPNEVHLTVDVVSWTTPFKRKRTGLCSTWLAGLDPQQGLDVTIPVWFNKGSLPPPLPSLSLILIGPGTGCAPFRAFIEERAIQSRSTATATAPILFFFGCRNEESDFLYKDFWASHSQNDGLLTEERGGGFYVAFSRDQPQKIYVQHKMQEKSQRIWSLLNEGAAIYVAGSSTKMPTDVLSTFEEIVCKESGVSKESAGIWLRALERAGKYNVEAWS